MPRTASDAEYKKTVLFLNENVLPQFKKIIDIVNAKLLKHGVRVAADLNWVIEGLTQEEIEEFKDEDKTQGRSKSG